MKALNFDNAWAPPGSQVWLGEGEYVPAPSNPSPQFVFVQTLWQMVPEARSALERMADQPHAPDAVRAWAENLNVSDEWFVEGASMLVESWREHPTSRGLLWQWPAPAIYSHRWEPPRAWNPVFETEGEYDAYLASYKLTIREAAEAKGLKRTPVKRNIAHFRWLVAHQVQELTYVRIADQFGSEEGVSEASVGQAITEVAQQIGLTLRPAPKR